MLVKVLVDNRKKEDSDLKIEHGLSLYVETSKYKCLVDVGLSNAFVKNARKMGVDLADIDYVFISHGHVDHVGGLPFFLAINKKARVILSGKALSQKYFSKRRGLRDISADINVINHLNRFQFISTNTKIDDEIQVIHNFDRVYPMPKANKFLYKDTCYIGKRLDDFDHELVFVFGENAELLCTGCAHNGILNIIDTVSNSLKKPTTVIGGFHLLDSDEKNNYETDYEINEIAQILKKDFSGIHYYTGHCTGDNVLETMKNILQGKLTPFYTGMSLTI